jgi:hypothetical protein
MKRTKSIRKLITALLPLLLALLSACPEINTPGKPGIGGLDEYADPVRPAWRKKDGGMLFYAEIQSDKTEFTFENPLSVPADISCVCILDKDSKTSCGCAGESEDVDCACKSIAVTAAAAEFVDEHGIIFAERAAGDEGLDKTRRIKFTVKNGASTGTGAWTIVWYDGAADNNTLYFQRIFGAEW